jgi:hypothetical protein
LPARPPLAVAPPLPARPPLAVAPPLPARPPVLAPPPVPAPPVPPAPPLRPGWPPVAVVPPRPAPPPEPIAPPEPTELRPPLPDGAPASPPHAGVAAAASATAMKTADPRQEHAESAFDRRSIRIISGSLSEGNAHTPGPRGGPGSPGGPRASLPITSHRRFALKLFGAEERSACVPRVGAAALMTDEASTRRSRLVPVL